MGRGFGAMGEELWELRSTNWQLQNSHWDEKYNIGNGVAKELICMTHGYGKRRGDCLRGVGGAGWKEQKGKSWETVTAQSIKYVLNLLKNK